MLSFLVRRAEMLITKGTIMTNVTWIFVGQNASCGTPNSITGRMSTYGDFYQAPDRATAKQWAEQCDDGNAHTIIAVGGKRAMRQFNLGASMRDFEENLANCPEVYRDSETGELTAC